MGFSDNMKDSIYAHYSPSHLYSVGIESKKDKYTKSDYSYLRFTYLLNRKNTEKWGIIGVSLYSEETFNKLVGQELVFNALSMSSEKKEIQQVSSISDFFVAKKDGQFVLDALSNEQIKIVSLTITEKGYCLVPSSGELDLTSEAVIYDLEHPKAPRSAIAFIVYSLNLRMNSPKSSVCRRTSTGWQISVPAKVRQGVHGA